MTPSKLALATGIAACLAVSSTPRPAVAQSQGTINTLIGAAAVVGGIILYNNYVHKRQAANQVVGYTRNGGTVYGDGRVVFPGGATVYPNANGQYPTGQYAYYAPSADPNAYAYDPQRSGRYDQWHRHGNGYAYGHANGNNGHHYGHDRDDRDDRDDRHGHGHGHGD